MHVARCTLHVERPNGLRTKNQEPTRTNPNQPEPTASRQGLLNQTETHSHTRTCRGPSKSARCCCPGCCLSSSGTVWLPCLVVEISTMMQHAFATSASAVVPRRVIWARTALAAACQKRPLPHRPSTQVMWCNSSSVPLGLASTARTAAVVEYDAASVHLAGCSTAVGCHPYDCLAQSRIGCISTNKYHSAVWGLIECPDALLEHAHVSYRHGLPSAG